MSGERMRLFVAFDIPEKAREILSGVADAKREELAGARWVRPENLHLTLKFIGEYREDDLGRLSQEIRAAAERCPSFTAALGGCGAFPSRRKARVIWVGLSEGADEAGHVARKLDARLEKVGIKREPRPFRGHLTLARLKRPGDCTEGLEGIEAMLEELEKIPFVIGEVTLYRSILGPQGPKYTVLERIPLKEGSDEAG